MDVIAAAAQSATVEMFFRWVKHKIAIASLIIMMLQRRM